ncbi:precorrin-3B synthase [Kribbella flavida DSM 17836]|uniref:Precorrin-3B synthase n=1 Tax=Kribbella flavida (strain DSM 17836 / JCM 10339 / NBRC 14399) TaxID=479435 RepID=D2Q3H5_KRIFD|nr:precorrin-3B synthase [Kribbella flavida]ADB34098.1 precorrin-3B synthase [Kribbella flavida DSM 17836]
MRSAERSQPDRCPGVLAVHQAADGGLARVRLPGGMLTAAQLRVLAVASAELGDGNLELTSRGNLQIRALRPGAPKELSDRLYAAGLLPSITHERVRNILASPLSGLDTSSLYDVLPLAVALDQQLCGTPRLAELPGRFLFALDDGRGDLATSGADVAVRMLAADQAALVLAGTDTGVRVAPADAPSTMLRAAEAFLDEREAQHSSAWRLAELENGADAVLAQLRAALQHSPASPSSSLPTGKAVQVGTRLSGNGLVVGVPLGSLSPAQAAALMEAEELRVTPWRSVVMVGAKTPAALVEARLTQAGLVVDPESPWNRVTACAGRPGCGKALADVRADARRVTAMMPARHRPVHWSGCERRCGQPTGDFVDVLAVADGYSVDGSPAATAEQSVMRMR